MLAVEGLELTEQQSLAADSDLYRYTNTIDQLNPHQNGRKWQSDNTSASVEAVSRTSNAHHVSLHPRIFQPAPAPVSQTRCGENRFYVIAKQTISRMGNAQSV